MRQDAMVPVEPFRAILKRAMNEQQVDEIAAQIGITPRAIYRICNEQETIGFDLADRIVTYLEGPMSWFDRPSLNQVYRSVNFRRVDWAYPVSETVRESLAEKGRKALERCGTLAAASAELGVPHHTLVRVMGSVGVPA